MRDNEMQDALQSFSAEALELLAEMDDCLLRLEDDADNPELLNALFRTVHTIKGTAGLFGLAAVVDFTHEVETVLDHLRDRAIALTRALSSLLFGCKDQIDQLLRLEVQGRADAPDVKARSAALLAALGQHRRGGAVELAASPAEQATAAVAVPSSEVVWQIEAAFGADTFRDGFDPLSMLGYVCALGRVLALRTTVEPAANFADADPETCRLAFALTLQTAAGREQIDNAFRFVQETALLSIRSLSNDEGALVGAATPAADPAAESDGATTNASTKAATETPGPESGADTRLVRVPADKLDQLINLVGELVIAGSGNAVLARRHGIKELVTSNVRLTTLIEDIRDRTLALRMVPIGDTFVRFRRIVRDLATRLGKQVELKMVGGEAELDKSMVEMLNDPLVHIVRNALDHGIETPERRQARGVSPTGTLTLAARHEGGGVLITVSDDGAGLNRERILAKARERGIVGPDAQLADAELDQLIFAAGFSTAEVVTDVSGRGVGMDVVRRAVENLRGSIKVVSMPGQGTRFEIRLPLTLAMINGFHVRVAEHQFVLPMDAVVECINNRHLAPPEPGRCTGHLALRGAVLPVLHLRELFQLNGPPCSERQSILVVRNGEQRVGLVTDALLGEGQTVIKPMGELFAPLEGIAGSTVLGNGDVALILDVAAIVAMGIRADATAATAPALKPSIHPPDGLAA